MSTRPIASPEPLGGLAHALLAAAKSPSLLLDRAGNIVMASESFCRTFGVAVHDVIDRPLAALDAWAAPPLRALLAATGPSADAPAGDCEIEVPVPNRDKRRVAINVQRLDCSGPDDGARLLTITDAPPAVSDGADTLRRNDLSMQELRHRTANSLQIVASVLRHSARDTASAETRAHLMDGYNRIMAIASVQQQLAITCRGQVDLRMYLTELCDSIATSLIGDHARIGLTVNADDGEADADTAASLGLIVTELVINALKHAFPDDAAGRITVDYRRDGAAWTLSVSDTGVGIASVARMQQPMEKLGLGGKIVDVNARKLGASVRFAPGARVDGSQVGTTVSIVRP